jgi:hypothetical protein
MDGKVFMVSEKLLQMDQFIEDAGGEITPEMMDEYFSAAEQIETLFADAGIWILGLKNEEQAAREEARRIEKRAQAVKARIESARKLLARYMLKLGKPSVKDHRISLSARKGKGKLVIENETLLPDKYYTPQVPVRQLNLEELQRRIVAGELQLPDDLFTEPETPPPVLDEEALKSDLEGLAPGLTIPGAHLEEQFVLTVK